MLTAFQVHENVQEHFWTTIYEYCGDLKPLITLQMIECNILRIMISCCFWLIHEYSMDYILVFL